MYLRELASNSYVLLQSKWTVEKARRLIEQLNPTHGVVHRSEPEDFYYLYTKSELMDRLADNRARTLFEALDLHEDKSTATKDSYSLTEQAPDRVIVLEKGQIAGFLDATQPPNEYWTKRGGVQTAPARPEPRSLVTQFPDRVRLSETVSLLVGLSTEAAAISSLPVALPVGAAIDVVIVPKRGLMLEGRQEGSLVVLDHQESLPLQFKLKATELGPARLQVLAFHLGQPLGAVTLAPIVIAAEVEADDMQVTRSQEIAPVVAGNRPDLSLIIFERQSNGQTALTFRLSAADTQLGLNLKPFGPVVVRSDPLTYFRDFFTDIDTWPVASPQDRARVERRLAAKGALLFERLLPLDLQVLLWNLRDRIKNVQIQSEEPWIPWELCKLQNRDQDGRIVDGPFLCEAYQVTRWLPGIGFKGSLTLKNVALVLPSDSGLRMANSEGQYLLSLASGGRKVERVPATFLDVTKALSTGKYDAWHFTGHGSFRAPDPNRSAMLLEQSEELTPDDLCGVVSNLGQARPLVFLNTCQIGRSAMSLTDIGGWVPQLLRAGAAAVVGAYWSVDDKSAHAFAQNFYDRLLAGLTIGQAAQDARAATKPQGDTTWLAYTVFADPCARVES